MTSSANDPSGQTPCDIIVIGSGAAGLAAAATAASMSMRVLLLEAAETIGGTTALSAGSVWIPNTMLARDADPEAARTYLDAVVCDWSSREMREAFFKHGPEMVQHLQGIGALDLVAYPHHPDYIADAPGAVLSGRALGPRPFDGRDLGDRFDLLRPPLPEFTLLGGMMVDRTDIGHLMGAGKSTESFMHAMKLVTRFGLDRLVARRGRRLVMGNALAGRLLKSVLRQGVTIRTAARVSEITMEDQRAVGVVVDGVPVTARRGVIVATGGFSHHARLRSRHYPAPAARYSVVPFSNEGGGLDLLCAAGGRFDARHANAAFWAPASTRRRSDGSLAVFPHFLLDRAKPGIIAVDPAGRRFVNESTTYQLFVEAMYRANAIPCYLICNGAFIRRYGLGIIRPMTRRLRKWVDEGYLQTSPTLADLAQAIGASPEFLADSVARNDSYAATGVDPDFQRGANAYNRNLGDPSHGPNPCLGPLGAGPYYALALHPADIGTSMGIATDTTARVLGEDGQPIPGLYAAGNDMASVMGGTYPGPGITLGPALTFGYAAAMDAAARQET